MSSLVLNLKLEPDDCHAVRFEALTFGDSLPVQEFTDSHGKRVSRVTLVPGTNCFRHDAIVAVSSQPDNYGFSVGVPQTPADIPVPLLRYALPSRYCDSDRLTDSAWQNFGSIEHGMPRVQAISRWIHDNLEYR